jgi:protocatechuate 3,4-dioxygenase beta subunit
MKPSPEFNPRVVEIYQATTRALQAVVKDLKVTEQELLAAGAFFNRLGQSGMCPSMLMATLAMTSVDTTRNFRGGTRHSLEGPFYTAGAPMLVDGDLLRGEGFPGATRMRLCGRVIDAASGEPLRGAELDFWQADHHGDYDNKGFRLRGIVLSDKDGKYQLDTIMPLDYSAHDDDPIGELYRAMDRHNRRAAHIHVKARSPGFETLTTQLYMGGSTHINNDYVEGAVSDDLLLHAKPGDGTALPAGMVAAQFDIALLRTAGGR